MEHEDEPRHYLVGHVREALARDPRANELNVDVTVAGRRVFLTGEVASVERSRAVADIVRELLPGYEVRNETTVPPITESDESEELS